MGEGELVNLNRAVRLAREQMSKGEFKEEFEEGQNWLEALDSVGRNPGVAGREIKGLDEGVFDGNAAFYDIKGKLGSMRDKRDSRFIGGKGD